MFIPLTLHAFDKQALRDSVNRYVNERYRVGDIQLPRIQVKGNNITVNANKQLSWAALRPDEVRHIRLIVSHYVLGNNSGKVTINTDGYELGELIPARYQKELGKRAYTLPEQRHPLTNNLSIPYSTEDGLAGIHLALYGSHGLYFNQQQERWIFQRAKLLTTVEDVYTSSYVQQFLVPMLENAGAVVIQPRERDTQTEEVIVDNSSLTLPDGWQTADGGWHYPQRPLLEGENPFSTGDYAYTETEAEALLYIPEIEQAGDYAVYVSYKTLRSSTKKARYTVVHSGVETEFEVNQQMSGGTWVYLGTFRFQAGMPNQNYVRVVGNGKNGAVITSDAVRFGGGMGNVARYKTPKDGVNSNDSLWLTGIPQTSYQPRYVEGARYYMQYAGVPDSIYNYTGSQNDYTDDFASRGRWINYLAGGSDAIPNGEGLNIPIHLGLAFHSDAGLTRNDTTIGTLVIYTDRNNDRKQTFPTGKSRMATRNYGDYVQTQLTEDIRALFDSCWSRRELKNASYSETRNPNIPTIILECLSHQNLADMRFGLNPRFRFTVSRAVYKGILKFLHDQYGMPYAVQPLPVQDFRIDFADSTAVLLSWKERTDSLEATAKPTYYIIYQRTAGSDWDNGTMVTSNSYQVRLKQGMRTDFYVRAGNKGGVSFPSETLTTYIAPQEKGRVMIINAFNRVDAPESFSIDSAIAGFHPYSYAVPYGRDWSYIGQQYCFDTYEEWKSDDNGGFGASYSDYAGRIFVGNTFDYPVLHGSALQQLGYSFVSASASSIDTIPSGISLVDIICGKQKDFCLTDALMQYRGNILLSGAYIDILPSAVLHSVFHSKYVGGFASHRGTVIPIDFDTRQTRALKPYSFYTEPNENTLHAENSSGIEVEQDKKYKGTARCIARYQDTRMGAAVATKDSRKTVLVGFPLESLEDFDKTYINIINWLEK